MVLYQVRHRQINAAGYLLETGKLMPQCIRLDTGKFITKFRESIKDNNN